MGLKPKAFSGRKTEYRLSLYRPGIAIGIALITVDEQAENCIVVAGANARLLRADVDKAAEAIRNAGIFLMQLEIPLDTVCYAADIAFKAGKK